MSHKGIDVFFVEPGTVEEMRCQACGSLCEVRRDVDGPTSAMMAMAKKTKRHDVFSCPHSGEAWHDQAVALWQAIEETPSKRVAELMRLDLEELLEENVSK